VEQGILLKTKKATSENGSVLLVIPWSYYYLSLIQSIKRKVMNVYGRKDETIPKIDAMLVRSNQSPLSPSQSSIFKFKLTLTLF